MPQLTGIDFDAQYINLRFDFNSDEKEEMVELFREKGGEDIDINEIKHLLEELKE